MSALHELLGRRALELLPRWEQEFWAEERDKMPSYCCYPDTHLECQWNAPEKLPYYERYCLMPDGHVIPHGPVDKNWICAAFTDTVDAEPNAYVLQYYCGTILRLMREGNAAESARFAGTLGHYIQDSCNLGHCFNNILLNRLFPGEGDRQLFYHGALDSWPFDAQAVTDAPQLMGCTPEETVFFLTEKLMGKVEENGRICIPFLTAIQKGDTAAADRFSQDMNADAVLYTAGIWHTLFCLAFDRIRPCDREAFRVRELTDSQMILSYDSRFNREQFIRAGIPFYDTLYPNADPCRARLAVSPYAYEPTVDYAIDSGNHRIPLQLRIDGTVVTGERGLAASTYSVASYRVPGNLYRELEVYAGVHPASKSGEALVLGIWCHEAEEKLLAKGEACRDADAVHFRITLPENCRTISLLSAGAPGSRSAVWMSPRLISRIH